MTARQTPLVSIITIVYNREAYLEQAINSVLQQSYPNIEYIVIDGGSTDNSVSIIKKYASKIQYWVSEPDNGIADAFNKGLMKANGNIIGFINADDWYEPIAVEKAVEYMNEVDIVYGDLRLWKNNKVDFIVQGDHAHLEDEMTLNHPTVFIRKLVYDQFGAFDKEFKCAMDYELMMRFKSSGCRFKHIPAVIANMRWDGVSDSQWLLGCKETLLIKNTYLPERKFLNRIYYYKHILAIAIPRMLNKMKLDFITRLYRTKFAKLKKSYE
jgi:glycosyltransferase involved in cell wall biosynthesis